MVESGSLLTTDRYELKGSIRNSQLNLWFEITTFSACGADEGERLSHNVGVRVTRPTITVPFQLQYGDGSMSVFRFSSKSAH